MSNPEGKFLALENSIDSLLERMESLTTLAKKQTLRIEGLSKELEACELLNDQLKLDNSDLKQNVINSNNNNEIEKVEIHNQRINELVKEINETISLLNN